MLEDIKKVQASLTHNNGQSDDKGFEEALIVEETPIDEASETLVHNLIEIGSKLAPKTGDSSSDNFSDDEDYDNEEDDSDDISEEESSAMYKSGADKLSKVQTKSLRQRVNQSKAAKADTSKRKDSREDMFLGSNRKEGHHEDGLFSNAKSSVISILNVENEIHFRGIPDMRTTNVPELCVVRFDLIQLNVGKPENVLSSGENRLGLGMVNDQALAR